MILISILICSLESRAHLLTRLIEHLQKQVTDEVEILVNVDSKQKSTGKKRQELIEQAEGKYVIFIDDDDWVEDWYVSELLKAAESDADCFAINGFITTNGQNKILWRLSKDYQNVTIREGGRMIYLRTTNHITGVKRYLALQAGFPDKSNAEDKSFSDSLNQHLKTEHTIIPPMYRYLFTTHNKEY